MNTRNRRSRRPVYQNTRKASTATNSETMEGGDHVEGGAGDFEEVEAPMWIDEMFGVETITGSKLTKVYTTFMGLHQLQKKTILCDVNIKVEKTVFPAHKAVLAASSRFFLTMFTSGFQESRDPDVSVTGKPEAFKVILDYIYSCELTLTVDTVVDVLEMSHYLQLDSVMKRCEQFLIDELNNGVELDAKAAVISLATARTYGLEVLIDAAKRCIAKNFVPTDNFLDLMTMELLEEVLGRNDLKDEKQVFDTILAWLQHDWNERKKFAPALFRKIRLGIVPVGHLSKTFLNHPKLYAITECRELINMALDTIDAHKSGDPPLHFTKQDLFATRTMVNAILSYSTNIICGYYYDIETTSWIKLPKFPRLPEKDSSTSGDSCLSMDGHLYVSRGTGSLPRKLKCPQFLRLDMPNNRWVALEPMNKRRQKSCLVAGGRKIYAIGSDTDIATFSGEVYDIDTNTWGPLPSLDFDNEPGFRIESCKVLQDKLLVYGRKLIEGDEKHHLKMYDPANSGVWTTLMEARYNDVSPQAIVGLAINNDKCYRIINCLCSDGEFFGEATVTEIIIDFEEKTARPGHFKTQDLIASTAANKKKMAFCVNQDLYVIHNKQFFKTGVKIPCDQTDPIELESWKNLKQLPSQQSALVAQFMFDKDKWL